MTTYTRARQENYKGTRQEWKLSVAPLVFLTVAIASTTLASAETYKWADATGAMHFTDNLNSVPKKYRKIAAAGAGEDITTRNPDVERSLQYGYSRRSEVEKQEAEASHRAESERVQRLLSKTSCEGGIPGECGPGRACVYKEMFFQGRSAKLPGVCMANADADRTVATENQQTSQIQSDARQRLQDSTLNRKLDSIKDKTEAIDRRLKYGF